MKKTKLVSVNGAPIEYKTVTSQSTAETKVSVYYAEEGEWTPAFKGKLWGTLTSDDFSGEVRIDSEDGTYYCSYGALERLALLLHTTFPTKFTSYRKCKQK